MVRFGWFVMTVVAGAVAAAALGATPARAGDAADQTSAGAAAVTTDAAPVGVPRPKPQQPSPVVADTPLPTEPAASGPTPVFHAVPIAMVVPARELLDTNRCRSSDNLDVALRACKEIIRFGGLPRAKLGAYHNRSAEILFKLGRYAEALVSMDEALELDPVNWRYEANHALVKARADK
jgi:tetratricopeptide (TPR) repeat protein